MDSKTSSEYVLYLRKSNGRAGIARQRQQSGAHVSRLGGAVVGEYVDTDATAYQRVGGKRPERAEFDLMLGRLRVSPGLGVAAWHADRLIRSSGDTEMLIEVCAAGSHPVETARGGGYDLGSATGRKRLRDDANSASYEVDHAIERITAAKLEAAAAGTWLGGPVPWGWSRHERLESGERTHWLELRQPEADAIRAATLDVTAGVSLHAIARRWNAAGLKTNRGHAWTAPGVRAVLLRARNAALHVHKGQLTGVEGDWPAILTEAQWRACRAILLDPARRNTPGNERRWLGSGLYLCGTCGHTMLASAVGVTGKPGTTRTVYRCGDRPARKHVARAAEALDAFVGLAVVMRLQREDAAPALVPRLADTTRLSEELAAVRGELDDLAVLAGDGTLTVRQMSIASKALRERETHLEARLAEAARPSVLSPFASGDPSAVWERLDLDRKRAVLAELMTVTVHPAPKGRPAGWQPGDRYFHAESIKLESKEAQQ
jgi:site-specific DNA recombinase